MKTLEELEPKVRKAFVEFIEEYWKLQNERVTKKEFNELKEVVKELVEAQKRTEEELFKLIEEHRETGRQLGGLSQNWDMFWKMKQ